MWFCIERIKRGFLMRGGKLNSGVGIFCFVLCGWFLLVILDMVILLVGCHNFICVHIGWIKIHGVSNFDDFKYPFGHEYF